MNLHSFIFTEKSPEKYYRHIAFWICSCLPFVILGVIAMYTKAESGHLISFLSGQASSRLPNLAIDAAFTYIVVYSFIPLYQRNRITFLLVSRILGLTILAFIVKGLLWYSNMIFVSDYEKKIMGAWFLLTNFFNDGCIMRCCLFLACKMLKNYFIRSEEKIGILRENATAELQLLKAQVHPHFLFNTLNNIYSFSLKRSPVAASLVLKLSDTLRYMITECEAALVPLDKELKMLVDYAGLESVRYGNRINISININGNTADKVIAPLLLIPLVENSFKHGASQMLDEPWIKLDINVDGNSLGFRVRNNKPLRNVLQEGRNGIGLKNVQKRLSLLYPQNHELKISNSPHEFEVFLNVPLSVQQVNVPENNMSDYSNLTIAYGNR
jgi:hypothetical protein